MIVIEDVANLFDKELGEEFEIATGVQYLGKKYRFDEDEGIIARDENGREYPDNGVLVELIMGDIEIKPWRPQNGDEYWYIASDYRPICDVFRSSRTNCLCHYALGNCFPNEEKAKENGTMIVSVFQEVCKELKQE